MRAPVNLYLLAIAIAVSVPSVCPAKSKKEPIFVDPGFQWDQVNTVYILSADIRIDKGKSPEKRLETVGLAGHTFLKKRGYRTTPEVGGKHPSAPATIEVSEDGLKDPQESWVRKLGPDDARWVLILALEDATSHLTFGSTGKAIIMGALFDRQTGKLLWRAIGTAQSGQGGLLGMAMKSAMMDQAIFDAIKDLATMVPKRK